MPPKVVIATPLKWMDIVPSDVEREPAIARVNRQARSETMAMLHSKSTFYVYIDRFNFKPLFEWIERIMTKSPQPKIKVQIMLMHKMSCFEDLEQFATSYFWLDHTKVQVKVYSSYRNTWLPSKLKLRSRDKQCRAVKEAISIAEYWKPTSQDVAPVLQALRNDADWEWACGRRCRRGESTSLLAAGQCSNRARMAYMREAVSRNRGSDLRWTVLNNLLRDESLGWTNYCESLDWRKGSCTLANPWHGDNHTKTQGSRHKAVQWRSKA